MVTKHFALTLLLLVVAAECDVFNLKPGELEHLLTAIEQFGDVSVANVLQKFQNGFSSYAQNANVSSACRRQLAQMRNDPALVITMLDASSKIIPGFMVSSRLDLGNYDECINIEKRFDDGKILGKFCAAGLIVPDLSDVKNRDLAYKLSICIPHECTAADLISLTHWPLFQDKACSTKEPRPWGVGGIITLFIMCNSLLLIVLSTAYDIYICKKELKPRHPLFKAFSLLAHVPKLLKTSEGNRDQIEVFHGMKTISMMWVIAGHGFVGFLNMPTSNYTDGMQFKRKLYSFYITSAVLAVDTFFYMSGFLLAYQYFKVDHRSTARQIKSIPLLYVHRYLRLTPAVLMLYLFSMYILPHLGSGPMYSSYCDSLLKTCEKYWWPALLYVQNYYNYDDLCLTHTWYLSADMQMFILSPLLLIPLAVGLKHGKYKLCMIGMILVNVTFTFLPMVLKLRYRNYTNAYDTHSRLINYTMGITIGLYIRKNRDAQFLNGCLGKTRKSVVNLVVWAIILLGMLTTCICLQATEMDGDYVSNTIFSSLMRPAWCIGLSWIVYSSFYGYGGIINWFLSRPLFQVGGKLSYSMYLMHGIVVAHYVMMLRTRMYFSDYIEFYLWCGYLVISIIVALIWTLAFESPMIAVERFIFGGIRQKAKRTETTENENNNKV